MNIKYMNVLCSNNKSKVREIYNDSFPDSEKFPFLFLKKCSKSKSVSFNEILYNNKTIGIDYILNYNDTAYLMYFAIDKSIRNRGYGSNILKDIIKKYNNVLLSIEKVNEDDGISYKRKQFYLRNGFYETGKFTIQNNVEYEILCSNENYNLTKDILINIYKQMSNSKILQYLINKKFNLLNIELIEN